MIININSNPPTQAIGITTSTEIFISIIIYYTKILETTQMIRNINSNPPTQAIGITTSTEIFISFIIKYTHTQNPLTCISNAVVTNFKELIYWV